MRSWLVKARTDRGMTQADLAKKLEMSETYYAYIERGERQKNMDISLASKLSAIFEIPLQRIVDIESMPEPEADDDQKVARDG